MRRRVSWDWDDGRTRLHALFAVLGLLAVAGWLTGPWLGLA